MNFSLTGIACSVFFAIAASTANAQDTVKDLATKASAELRLLTAFQTLERMTSQMNHFLVYAIEAERGGWGILEFVETTDYGTNPYVIRSTSQDVQVAIARANSTIVKSKVATEDELKNAAVALENLTAMIELSPRIADMISEGEYDAAAALYHEIGQPAHANAIRGAQSSVGTVQRRLSKTLLDIRVAK